MSRRDEGELGSKHQDKAERGAKSTGDSGRRTSQHTLDGLVREVAARAAESEAIFAAMTDAVIVYDAQMRAWHVNPSFVALYGFSPVGMHVTEVIERVNCRWADGRPFVLEDQPTPRALRGERVQGALYSVRRADGSEAIVETAAGPMFVGNRVTGSVAIWRDVTERYRAQRALADSEHRFRSLIEQSPVAIGLGRDGKHLYANPAFLRMFGFRRLDEVVGHPMIEVVAPSGRAELTSRILRRTENRPVPAHFETTGLRADGTQFPLGVMGADVVLADGPAMIGYLTDLTERRRAMSDLELANRALETKNLALRELLDSVEAAKQQASRQIVDNLDRMVADRLRNLKGRVGSREVRIIENIETSLREIASPFVGKLTHSASGLTPTEIRVCQMIRAGMTGKEIAAAERVSAETISTHRRNIRRKLGLTNQHINLESHLQSIGPRASEPI